MPGLLVGGWPFFSERARSLQGKGAFYSLEAMLLFVNASELNQPPMKDYMKVRKRLGPVLGV